MIQENYYITRYSGAPILPIKPENARTPQTEPGLLCKESSDVGRSSDLSPETRSATEENSHVQSL